MILSCTSCPKACGGDRKAGSGYCRSGEGHEIAAICRHLGEEPVFGAHGICNVFYYHCNLQCVYCQNHQISRNDVPVNIRTIEDVIHEIEKILQTGVRHVGFVSPSHMIDRMTETIGRLRARGHKSVTVMNTGSYDKKDTIRSLEGLIGVYLADFRYADGNLARRLSGAPDYPEVALRSLREMYRQKGAGLILGEDGTIQSGLIIRHLILPGQVEHSKACLRLIAEELSPSVHVSLMSQFDPVPSAAGHPELDRRLDRREYMEVEEELSRLGFYRGWVQEMTGRGTMRPDFSRDEPFSISSVPCRD